MSMFRVWSMLAVAVVGAITAAVVASRNRRQRHQENAYGAGGEYQPPPGANAYEAAMRRMEERMAEINGQRDASEARRRKQAGEGAGDSIPETSVLTPSRPHRSDQQSDAMSTADTPAAAPDAETRLTTSEGVLSAENPPARAVGDSEVQSNQAPAVDDRNSAVPQIHQEDGMGGHVKYPTCPYCNTSPVEVILTCEHVMLCHDCCLSLKDCPVCQRPVASSGNASDELSVD